MPGNFKNELLVQETIGVQKFKAGDFTNYSITGEVIGL